MMYNRSMTSPLINNLFTDEEISVINQAAEKALSLGTVQHYLEPVCRKDYILDLPKEILDKVYNIALKNFKLDVELLYPHKATLAVHKADFSPGRSDIQLATHVDSSTCGMIIDYCLSTNLGWPIGIDQDAYILEENQAIILHANTEYHWRPMIDIAPDTDYQLIFFEMDSPSQASKRDEEKFLSACKACDALTDRYKDTGSYGL
jgi:hypothetical protein